MRGKSIRKDGNRDLCTSHAGMTDEDLSLVFVPPKKIRQRKENRELVWVSGFCYLFGQ
jgi:hypothetical protein